jgi:hypothetical protein
VLVRAGGGALLLDGMGVVNAPANALDQLRLKNI